MKWSLIGYYVLVSVIVMVTCIKKAWSNESFSGFIKDMAVGLVFSLLWPLASLVIIVCVGVTKLMDYIDLKMEERFKATREDVGLGG